MVPARTRRGPGGLLSVASSAPGSRSKSNNQRQGTVRDHHHHLLRRRLVHHRRPPPPPPSPLPRTTRPGRRVQQIHMNISPRSVREPARLHVVLTCRGRRYHRRHRARSRRRGRRPRSSFLHCRGAGVGSESQRDATAGRDLERTGV